MTRTSGSFRNHPGVSRNPDRPFAGLERDDDDRAEDLPPFAVSFFGCAPTKYTTAITIMMMRKVIRMGST
jgi:hypothetical protein